MKFVKANILQKGDDARNMSNRRPVSILLIFSNLLERLIHRRITGHVNKHFLLTPCQFGFWKQYSIEISLLQKEIIAKAIAFDSISYTILLYKLEYQRGYVKCG